MKGELGKRGRVRIWELSSPSQKSLILYMLKEVGEKYHMKT
jgi:hypothetical protein